MVVSKHEIDMSKGSILKNILLFALPLMLSNVLQLFYNAADTVVVGRWAGTHALSAVGATGSLNALLVHVFVGLSVGTSVVVSRRYGSGDMESLNRAAHTSVALGLTAGIMSMLLGEIFCRPLLELMSTPEDIIDLSVLYMRIYFIGIPASMVYNFGAAVLRAVGDTRRPLYILAATGIVNVILNLVLVIVFHMSVAGVAVATAVANYMSAGAILYCLRYSDAPYKLNLKKLKIHKDEAKDILAVGVPAGLQSSVFSLSNTVVQSAVNSFGTYAVAGRAAASSLEGFVYTAMNAFYHAAITSVSQNYGAKQEKRVYHSIYTSIICAVIIGFVLGLLNNIFADFLLGIYIIDSPESVECGKIYLKVVGLTHFILAVMDIMGGALRGIGYSKTPMVTSLVGACGFRLLWVFFILPLNRTLEFLFICWPISWVIVIVLHIMSFMSVRKRAMKRMYEV